MTPRQLAVAVAALLVGLLGRLALRVSPRLGVRLVRWAAGLRYRQHPERAAMRAEELAALVDDRPGGLLKLLTGLGFALHALAVAGLRARAGSMRRPVTPFIKFAGRHRVGVAMAMAVAWAVVAIVITANVVAGIVLPALGAGVVSLAATEVVLVAVSGVGAVVVTRIVGVSEHKAVIKVVSQASYWAIFMFPLWLQVAGTLPVWVWPVAMTVGGIAGLVVVHVLVNVWTPKGGVRDEGGAGSDRADR